MRSARLEILVVTRPDRQGVRYFLPMVQRSEATVSQTFAARRSSATSTASWSTRGGASSSSGKAWARRHAFDPATVIRVAHGRRTSETLREVAPHLDIPVEVAILDKLEEVEHRGVEVVTGARELLS